jgi:hypothetical protein
MKSMPILIAAFVTLLVGVMLIGTVASETYAKTGRGTLYSDQSVNISNCYNGDSGYCNQTIAFGGPASSTFTYKGVKCGNGAGSWVDGSVVITNQTGATLTSGNYTVNYGNNSIVFKNTSTTDPVSYGGNFFGGNISLIDYRYYPTDYICEGWQRTVLNLVPGFFGFAILLASVGLFYAVARNEGIIGSV